MSKITLLQNNTCAITFFASFLHLHFMHCTISISTHVYSYMLDHVELSLKEPSEQAQAEDLANHELSQGKSQCI
jgi:hypothetical protein